VRSSKPHKAMPRRRKGRGGGGGRSFTVSGKFALSFTVANGNTSVARSVTPSAFAPLANICLGFEYYRFTKLTARVPPIVRYETTTPQTTNAGAWAMAYLPEATNASTTGLSVGALETLSDCVDGTSQIVNVNAGNVAGGTLMVAGLTTSKTLRVKARTLRLGLAKMYRTQSATTGDPAVQQGLFLFAVTDAAGANTVLAQAIVSFTCKFFEPVDASSISLRNLLSTPAVIPRPISAFPPSRSEETKAGGWVWVESKSPA